MLLAVRTRAFGMRLLTGKDGLQAIESAGGTNKACFALNPESAYASAGETVAKMRAHLGRRPRTGQELFDELAARGKSPSSIGPINCKIRRQGNAWNSAWQSVSDQRDGKRNCLWQRVRFAA